MRLRVREGGLHGGRALLPLAAVSRAPRRQVPRHPRHGVVLLRLAHVHQPQPQLERRAGLARGGGSPTRGVIISHARRLERAREGDGVPEEEPRESEIAARHLDLARHLGRRACVTDDHVQRAAVGLHRARGQQQRTGRQAQREGLEPARLRITWVGSGLG